MGFPAKTDRTFHLPRAGTAFEIPPPVPECQDDLQKGMYDEEDVPEVPVASRPTLLPPDRGAIIRFGHVRNKLLILHAVIFVQSSHFQRASSKSKKETERSRLRSKAFSRPNLPREDVPGETEDKERVEP